MQVVGIDAFLVPSGDPHLSEYVHPHYERRSFISGFTGSAGVALVTQDSAMLWTDGRYFLQAEAELGPEWKLMRSNQGGVPPLEGWLATALAENSVVGIDPMVHSSEDAEKLTASLSAASRPQDLHTRPPHVIHPSTTRPPPVL
jgi:Xaa-Pro aminopeptidase